MQVQVAECRPWWGARSCRKAVGPLFIEPPRFPGGSDSRENGLCIKGSNEVFLEFGGGRFAYRFSNPAGERVLSATIAGQPLEPQRVYHVATIDYLLLGGDGHTWFGKGTNVIYGDVEVDAVASYMTVHSPLDPKIEGRITQP